MKKKASFIKNFCGLALFLFPLSIIAISEDYSKIKKFSDSFEKQKLFSREKAVEFAHRNREDLEAFIYARRANENNERVAISGYLPQVQFEVNKYRNSPYAIFYPDTEENRICLSERKGTNVGLVFSQLIFSGGGPIIDYKITKEQTKIIKGQEQNAYNTIQFLTEQSFLETQKLLLQKRFIKTKDESSKTVFEKNSLQKEVGFLNSSEWLSAATDYAQDQSDVANYPHNIEISIGELQRQTNSNIQTKEINLSLEKTLDITLEPLEYYMNAAQTYRPELKIQKHLARQAKLFEAKYKQQYIPNVHFYLETSDIKIKEQGGSADRIIGLEFTWNFDGFAGIHQSKAAYNTNIQYDLQKRDLEIRIDQEVKNLYYTLKNFINQLKVIKFQFEQARSALELIQNQYKVGIASQSDLALSELDYENARFLLSSLKIDIRGTYQNLLFVCGYPKKKHKNFRVVK